MHGKKLRLGAHKIQIAFIISALSSLIICSPSLARESWLTLSIQAKQEFDSGNREEALRLEQKALDLSQQVNGLAAQATLNVMDNLVQILLALVRYDDAEKIAQNVLALRQQALGPDNPLTILSMSRLAGILSDSGNEEKAEEIYRKALQRAREGLGQENRVTVIIEGNLGGSLLNRGKLQEAENFLSDAQKKSPGLLGERSEENLATMANMALLLTKIGRYEESDQIYAKLIPLKKQVSGTRDLSTIDMLSNYALLLDLTNQNEKAAQTYKEVVIYAREFLGEGYPTTLRAMSNYATFLDRLGQYQEAEQLEAVVYKRRRESLGPTHPDTLTSMNDAAAILFHEGYKEAAENLDEQVLRLRRQVLGLLHPDTLMSVANLASALEQLGRPEAAEKLFREALEGSKITFGPSSPTTLMFQEDLISNLALQKKATDAVTLGQATAEQILAWLGQEFYRTGNFDRRRRVSSNRSNFQDLMLNIALALPTEETVNLAASVVFRFKGLPGEEEGYLAHLTRLGRSAAIRNQAAEIVKIREQLGQLLRSQGPAAEAFAKTLERLNLNELELGRAAQGDAPSLQASKASLAMLRASLPPRSALLEFCLFKARRLGDDDGNFENHWAGVFVASDGVVEVRDLGPSQNTQQLINALISKPSSSKSAATALYRQLVAPFESHINKLDRLFVAPDDALYILPFGLLHDTEDRLLLARLDVRLLQRGRDFLQTYADTPRTGLVAVGGIDFSNVGSSVIATSPFLSSDSQATLMHMSRDEALRNGFGPLEHSAQEVEEIAKLYRQRFPDEPVTLAELTTPTKSWLLNLLPPKVLHLATHGFYRNIKGLSDNPMLFSGVALAGANLTLRQGGQDGVMFSVEAQELNLEGTELVVLSACDTGLGQIDYGDSIAGLVRALQTAGAQHVIVSVGPVDDRGAQKFMQLFYYHWLKQPQSDPAAALRDAQREAALTEDDDTWARFVLVGK